MVPKHLKGPINVLEFAGFQNKDEVKVLFDQIRSTPPKVKNLIRQTDLRRFVVTCKISGFEFHDALYDIGSSVSFLSKAITERLGLNTEASKVSLTLVDHSTKFPKGVVKDLRMKAGNCIVPKDFQVLDLVNGLNMPLILGRDIMATAGAVVDIVENKIYFAYINKNVLYKSDPPNKGVCLVPYSEISYDPLPAAAPLKSGSHKNVY
ncbi:hypothetical protein N665_0061s0023 [Sinapis alba]|nr:hypothetical protein N665_0061s0023 [Sinapis alba]